MGKRLAALAIAASIAVAGCGGRSTGSAASGQNGGSPSAARPPSSAGSSGSPLAGSVVIDLSWISARHGWALAAAPCGPGLCPRVARTSDGGRTWTALPAPRGLIQTPNTDCGMGSCVAHVRFATAEIGYLFGPALYQTSDGGRTWQAVPSPPVEDLEPAGGTVIRLVYDHGGCPGPCDRTVQVAAPGSGNWRTLLRLPPLYLSSRAVSAQVIRQGGSVIYVPAYGDLAAGAGTQQAVIFRSTDGGGTWQRLDDPCGGSGTAVRDAAGLAAAPGGFLAVLCAPRGGNGGDSVITSADNGSTWGPPRPVPGPAGLISAPGPGHLDVASPPVSGSGDYTYRVVVSADGGSHWSVAVSDTALVVSPGAAFLGFADSRTGWWIGDGRAVWITSDGGEHWRRQAFP